MEYGNLAQTGALATTGLGAAAVGGVWYGIAATALVLGVTAAYRLVRREATARP